MLKIHKQNTGTLIIHGSVEEIKIDLANEIIDSLLKIEGELEQSANMSRFKHITDKHILLCGYASLTGENLVRYLEAFLKSCNLVYEFEQLPESTISVLSDVLPYESVRRGTICGGITPDTETIDPNVRNLSDVFNMHPGIKTFSSCEGHIKNNKGGTFYILYNCDTFENLNNFSKALDDGIEETWKVYDFDNNSTNCSLLYEYGKWPHRLGIYFELRINYSAHIQSKLFEGMDYLANVMSANLEKQTQS